jgi:hypothetical protein
MSSIYYAYLTALFLILVGYVVGYTIGRLDLIYRTLCLFTSGTSGAGKPADFFSKVAAEDNAFRVKPKIDIDDSKFVAPIKTDNLAKTSDATLGKITTTEDDIQASVSRLAQLKGK